MLVPLPPLTLPCDPLTKPGSVLICLFIHPKKGPPSFMTEIVVINTPPLFPQPQTTIDPLSCSQGSHMVTYRFVWDSVRTAVCLHQSNFYLPSVTITGHSSLSPDFTSLFLHCQRSEMRSGQIQSIRAAYTLQSLHQTHKSDVKSAFSAPP